MILELDEDDLCPLTEDTSPGDWRELLTAEAIQRACDQADARVSRADALIDEIGAHAVVEALRRRGILKRPY